MMRLNSIFYLMLFLLSGTLLFGQEETDSTEIDDDPSLDLTEIVMVGKGVIDLEEDRATPVAVSTILKEEIQARGQGNVEFTELLENVPGVYVANQSGGFGDSEIRTRGFDDSNTAVLLNGQPINAVEDGRVFWSNWRGMSQIANALQIQRGLGSSKLAISSVGGTINIVSKATEKQQGGSIQGIVGNDSYVEGVVEYNSGINENGWGFSVLVSHWQAHRKFARGTYGEGQNYFFSIGKQAGRHNFNFLITGAPQLHGQNFSKQIEDNGNGLSYNRFGIKWNANYGFKDGESFSWRQNYYHKPVANLNWDWDINDDMNLSTVLYGSWGRGGGTGPLGNDFPVAWFNSSPEAGTYYNQNNGDFLFDRVVDDNSTVADGIGSFGNGLGVRASVNNHNWYGLISNFQMDVNENLNFNIGFDGRLYQGDHFRQITDLLGLSGYNDTFRRDPSLNDANGDNIVRATFDPNPWAALFNFADEDERVAYDYSEDINYIGTFGQIEYKNDKFSTFFQGSLSTQSFQREERWVADQLGNSEKINKIGYNLKGGAAYYFNESNTIFGNAGFYSRQPFFDNLIEGDLRFSNTFEDPEIDNEEITGLEAGYRFKNRSLTVNVNAYYTKWDNRFIRADGNYVRPGDGVFFGDVFFLISDVTQVHKGLEVDFAAKATRKWTVTGFASFGDWEYDGNVNLTVTDENDGTLIDERVVDLSGTKVGEAAQFTFGLGTKFDILKNLSIDANLNYYAQLYPFVDLDNAVEAGANNVEVINETLPSFALVNSGISYKYNLGGRKALRFRGNVRNLFNDVYLAQRDQFGFFFGNGRTWNASVSLDF